MGYHTNIAIDVDVLTRSIEINIKNKEKNIEKPNVHTFNHRHRTDRRVKGWLRMGGRLGGFAKVDNRFGYEKWT